MNNTILKSLSVSSLLRLQIGLHLQQRQTLVKKNFLITHLKVET